MAWAQQRQQHQQLQSAMQQLYSLYGVQPPHSGALSAAMHNAYGPAPPVASSGGGEQSGAAAWQRTLASEQPHASVAQREGAGASLSTPHELQPRTNSAQDELDASDRLGVAATASELDFAFSMLQSPMLPPVTEPASSQPLFSLYSAADESRSRAALPNRSSAGDGSEALLGGLESGSRASAGSWGKLGGGDEQMSLSLLDSIQQQHMQHMRFQSARGRPQSSGFDAWQQPGSLSAPTSADGADDELDAFVDGRVLMVGGR